MADDPEKTDDETAKPRRVDVVRQLLHERLADPDPCHITICHGDPGCKMGDDWEGCAWCYRVAPEDDRTAEEIEEDMLRIRAGH